MTDESQLNEPVPSPAPRAPLIPLLMDDEWEAPPLSRGRNAVIAAFIGIALVVTSVELLRNRERMWEPEYGAAWESRDMGRLPVRVTGTLSHDSAEPSEVLESRPPPPPPHPASRSPSPAGRGGQGVRTQGKGGQGVRPPGYLSINSTPWAEVSIDGYVVGNTPQVRIRVTPGRHHVLLAREGFQPHGAWIIVPAGGTVRLTDITLAGVAR
jgi:hypothetical protein